ncbi:tryptophan--tRNA ligase [Pseudalkalibacillus caeni]|uniref:Tryptophan--tRNA ligase n=1 Tax=Exobacillus caeni TaxID=2574798 RepID=A0A5R9F3J5_9BACL|nr:tryptophan--tRNA ligase [Pseudalkalibacillus caeni]TLS38177.1 tryptophan--tRNA ligase [Pseudalkalibacillus caeni]
MNRKKIVSGIRPTGNLHIGNYYGGMKGLINLQEDYHAHFFIADLHSLTTHPNPENLKKNVLQIARHYLAAGLDPERSVFYAQSSIAPEISELHTYLSMVMPLGDLLRCPTFKEKAKKHPDNVNYGLVGYPVLMTADILIHNGDYVPVGDDQLVHLEIARTIVRKFNLLYGETFPLPQPIKENAVRIPSLSGQGKMSKSDSQDSFVSMDDSPTEINKKTKKAYSDPKRVYKNDPGNPTKNGCNVFHLHSYFTDGDRLNAIKKQCLQAEIGCVDCKASLTSSILSIIEPFQERLRGITDHDAEGILLDGKIKAKDSAQQLIANVRKKIGLQMV